MEAPALPSSLSQRAGLRRMAAIRARVRSIRGPIPAAMRAISFASANYRVEFAVAMDEVFG